MAELEGKARELKAKDEAQVAEIERLMAEVGEARAEMQTRLIEQESEFEARLESAELESAAKVEEIQDLKDGQRRRAEEVAELKRAITQA